MTASTSPQLEKLSATVDPALREELERFVQSGSDGFRLKARAPVNTTVIRQMTDAVGDLNPIYSDETFAAKSLHRGIVAPHYLLYAWSLPGLEPEVDSPNVQPGQFRLASTGERHKNAAVGLTLRERINDLLSSYGYTSPAVTNMTTEYQRYLRPGDRLSFADFRIDDIAGLKRTSLGEGFFVTVSHKVFDADDAVVATVRQTYFRFKPHSARAADAGSKVGKADPAPMLSPTESANFQAGRNQTIKFADVEVGYSLSPLRVVITPTLIVAGAIASQDFQGLHHDYHYVTSHGHPDIFMNQITTSGLAGRYVTDWAGPEAQVKRFEFRLGRPNYPGDVMQLNGIVRGKHEVNERKLVQIDVTGDNRLGRHVTAAFEIEVPA